MSVLRFFRVALIVVLGFTACAYFLALAMVNASRSPDWKHPTAPPTESFYEG